MLMPVIALLTAEIATCLAGFQALSTTSAGWSTEKKINDRNHLLMVQEP